MVPKLEIMNSVHIGLVNKSRWLLFSDRVTLSSLFSVHASGRNYYELQRSYCPFSSVTSP